MIGPSLLASLVMAAAPVAAPRPHPLFITGARVLDPAGERWLEDQAVLVADGRIVEVGPAKGMQPGPGAIHLDLGGAWLVPGLIDLHTHLLLHPYDEAPWDDQVLKEELGLRTARAVAAARRTLEAGFTTIRDLGTEGAGFADVGLRDAVAQGIVPGPRILAVTRALVASGAYGPDGFDPRWDMPRGAQVADGPDQLRVAVRQQIAAGADWIKIYADYRRTRSAEATPTFSLEELKAVVDEARSAGLHVAAHATTDPGVRRAVAAGVRTVEHAYEASAEALALMRQANVALCPTLAAAEAYDRYSGDGATARRLEGALEMFRRARAAGVTLACGSDAGVFAHGDNVRELELMVQGGMTPAEALRAATAVAATVIDRGADLGRIAPGCAADLVAVAQDPLADITALRRPILVIQAGRVAAGRRFGADTRARGDPPP